MIHIKDKRRLKMPFFGYRPLPKAVMIKCEKDIKDFFDERGLRLYRNRDMSLLANRLGFETVGYPTKKSTHDGFIFVDGKKKIIGVNQNLSTEDIRFVIAHELGHYIHSLQLPVENRKFTLVDNIFKCENPDDEKDDYENLIDYYATAILLPMKSFCNIKQAYGVGSWKTEREVFENTSYYILKDLAEQFGVNVDVVVRRVVETNHLSRSMAHQAESMQKE